MSDDEAAERVWLLDSPPHELVRETPGDPVSGPRQDLPEVRALREEGWHLLDPDVVADAIVAAVWPTGRRTWVPDRAVPTETLWREDGSELQRPWNDRLRDDIESDVNGTLEAAGLPPRPRGRLWFVTLPKGQRDLNRYLAGIRRRGQRAGLSGRSNDPQWADFLKRTVEADFAAE